LIDLRVLGDTRYVEGQRLYIAECAPAGKATVIVDNRDLNDPDFVRL
jgi:uridine kinase